MGIADKFIDEITIEVVSGSGGRGSTSFRREKYVPNGGPDGGDGGNGGDVLLIADSKLTSLSHLRDRPRWQAAAGGDGGKGKRSGKEGEPLIIPVPVGTLVVEQESGRELADLNIAGTRVVVAVGGKGGRGNVHFRSSVRQSPRMAELGAAGQHKKLLLELRLIADLGLVGRPNAGKSTLLAALTNASPKIADYPFTTLSPNLGVMEYSPGKVAVVADVPGLVEHAHAGVGLGIAFLKHLRRTRLLVQVVDASQASEQVLADVSMIASELKSYGGGLENRTAIVVLNKLDLVTKRTRLDSLIAHLSSSSLVLAVSALTGEGIPMLTTELGRLLEKHPPVPEPAAPTIRKIVPKERLGDFAISLVTEAGEQLFLVSGTGVERLVSITDLENEEAVARLQRSLRRAGLDDALRAAGVKPGMTVRVGDVEFSFEE